MRMIVHTRYIAVVVAVFGVFLIAGIALAYDKEAVKLASWSEQNGIMTRQEYLRLDDMQTKIEGGGRVTDRDLSFTLNVLETKPLNPAQTVFRRLQAVTYGASGYTHWTSAQKGKLFTAALWLLAQPEPKNQVNGDDPLTTDKVPAMYLLNCVHDQRVLPYLRKLESDPNPQLSELATTFYKRIAGGKK